MFGSILTRMIFRELVKVFLTCLIGITLILLLAGIVAEASSQGLGPAQILAIIPLLIPSTLPYTIPATTLFATCVVYGRLAADNEILAIRASGVNIGRVLMPGIVLGTAMSLVTMSLYFHVIPYTHHLMRTMFLNDVEGLLYGILKKNNQINHPQLGYSMHVRGVQGRKLLDATFMRRNARGQTDVVARAREAELRVDMNRKMLLVTMRDGVFADENGAQSVLQDQPWEVPLPENLIGNQYRRPRDMTWEEMHQRRGELAAEHDQVQNEIALFLARQMMSGAPQSFDVHVGHLRRKAQFLSAQIRAIDVEFQMRPALALGCVFFVLIGCPVGIWLSRSDYLSSFSICFLPIVALYYPLVLAGTGMAKDGKVDPGAVVWIPDVLMGVIGVLFFWRLSRR